MKEGLELVPKATRRAMEKPSAEGKPEIVSLARGSVAGRVFDLQKIIGNQAIGELFRSGVLQARLKSGKQNSLLEKDADQAADHVTCMSKPAAGGAPVVQPLCPEGDENIQRQSAEEKEFIQSNGEAGEHQSHTPSVLSSSTSLEGGADHVIFFRNSDSLAYGPGADDVPKEYPAIASSAVGFDPGSEVGGETASQLDQILSNSQFLKPYIQDKLKQKSIGEAGKFIIHASDSDFDMAYMTLHHKLDQLNNPAFRKELEMKKGFYWPPEDTIHLRPLSNMSQALHEAIHKFSEMGFLSMFGRFVNEGTTQYFADKVQVEMGLPPAESHGYGPELAFATDLISYLGESFTAEQYFKDFDGPTMLGKLGLTLVEYNEKYRFGEDANARFLRYLGKLI